MLPEQPTREPYADYWCGCGEWVTWDNPHFHDARGNRKGQFRYYLRAALRERPGRRWNRFWAARWFWSAGRLGPVPVMYSKDYWRRSA